MKVTRTIKVFRAQAVKANYATKSFDVIAECEFTGTHATKTMARKSLVSAGFSIPKGTEIIIDEVGSKIYALDLDTFMSLAEVISAEQAAAEGCE